MSLENNKYLSSKCKSVKYGYSIIGMQMRMKAADCPRQGRPALPGGGLYPAVSGQ